MVLLGLKSRFFFSSYFSSSRLFRSRSGGVGLGKPVSPRLFRLVPSPLHARVSQNQILAEVADISKLTEGLFTLIYRRPSSGIPLSRVRERDWARRPFKFADAQALSRVQQSVRIRTLARLWRDVVRIKKDLSVLSCYHTTKFTGLYLQKRLRRLVSWCFSLQRDWEVTSQKRLFSEELRLPTKLRWLDYIRHFVSKRQLRGPWWKRAGGSSGAGHSDFRYTQRFGYAMRGLEVSDLLPFWHLFTRKRSRGTSWLIRSKRFFRTLLSYRSSAQIRCTYAPLFRPAWLHSSLIRYLVLGWWLTPLAAGQIGDRDLSIYNSFWFALRSLRSSLLFFFFRVGGVGGTVFGLSSPPGIFQFSAALLLCYRIPWKIWACYWIVYALRGIKTVWLDAIMEQELE